MFEWIWQNLSTIVICAVLAAVVVLIICSMVRNRKNGKTSCGCGSCGGCAMSDHCHTKK